MKKVPLYEIKNALSHYLRVAEKEEIVITRHGRPAGLLIGFESEDDWFEYRMQSDPAFLRRVEIARGEHRIRYRVKRAPGKGLRKKGSERRAK